MIIYCLKKGRPPSNNSEGDDDDDINLEIPNMSELISAIKVCGHYISAKFIAKKL
jgi:hypothetical protein